MNWIILSFKEAIVKILVLEPYYGGSHKTFFDGLQSFLPFEFTLLTLPAGRWKWRMRLAAPFFADKIITKFKETRFDALFCSSFVDVATLRSLLPGPVNQLSFFTYFHENQFAYPVSKEDDRDVHFGLTNLTTVLASDKVAFNSCYNMQSFLEGVDGILKICPDMKFEGVRERIESKASVLNPGIDFSSIDNAPRALKKNYPEPPVIVWNHRWEHDKNPENFFEALFEIDAGGFDFRVIILGQSFRDKPLIFTAAREKLRHNILHCGFVESRDEYARLLAMGDIVVSTSNHEFYGISVIEAVRAGCVPLLPHRLSYPELFPAQYLYKNGELLDKLKTLLKDPAIRGKPAKNLTKRFSWTELRSKYIAWFTDAWHKQ